MRRVVYILLVIFVWLALPSEDALAAEKVRITGSKLIQRSHLQDLIGTPPRRGRDRRIAWAKKAVHRIVFAYRKEGYRYARAWMRVDDDGTVRIHVDEGKMERVIFVGAGALQSFMLQSEKLLLPRGVYHEPTVRSEVVDLSKRFSVAGLHVKVVETAQQYSTPLGNRAPRRVLKVYIPSRETFGWEVNVSLDSTWGLLPTVAYRHRGLLFDDDRAVAGLGVAVPYREYLFEEEPQFRWVHGEAWLDYRFPPFAKGHLAPSVNGDSALSYYRRLDEELKRAYLLRSRGGVSLDVLLPPSATIRLGTGVDHSYLFAEELTDDALEPPNTDDVLRYAIRLRADVDLSPTELRRDLHDEIQLIADNLLTADVDWLLDLRLRAQAVFRFGDHDLIFRAQAVYLHGDVRFFDEVPLAGSYQRVFFGNRYWMREAFQLEVAFRLAVYRDVVKIGVFHDGSIFGDRRQKDTTLGLANGFGPSLHFLLFDLFALDVYYGFGFASVGFDHNLAFSMRTVF